MKKTVLDEKWKCYKPNGSNGFWYVETISNESIATTYVMFNGECAKRIVSDHNEQLKVKKALAKTPFAK